MAAITITIREITQNSVTVAFYNPNVGQTANYIQLMLLTESGTPLEFDTMDNNSGGQTKVVTWGGLSSNTTYKVFSYCEYPSFSNSNETTFTTYSPTSTQTRSISGAVRISEEAPFPPRPAVEPSGIVGGIYGTAWGAGAWGGMIVSGGEKEYSTSIEGRVRVSRIDSNSLTGSVRIESVDSATVNGSVRISKSVNKTITGNIRIEGTKSSDISGAVRIAGEQERSIEGAVCINNPDQGVKSESIYGVVRVARDKTSSMVGSVRIEAENSAHIGGGVMIYKTSSSSITGMVRIAKRKNKTIKGAVRIKEYVPGELPAVWEKYGESNPESWDNIEKLPTEWNDIGEKASEGWSEMPKENIGWTKGLDAEPDEWHCPLEEEV